MNGFGVFYWKDGRIYQGEYKEDKKHNFGMYYGVDNKKYEGFWEFGSQKALGKYTKNDGTMKLGNWNDNKLIECFTNEEEVIANSNKIDDIAEITKQKIQIVLLNMKDVFMNYLPNVEFESLLGIM